MSGFRDMLRMLKRSHSVQHHSPPSPLPSQPVLASTTSLNTESFMGNHSQHHYTHGQLPRKGSKASVGHDSLWSGRDQPNSPYAPPSSVNYKGSPRRPSLASIFRIGQKNKSMSTASTGESSQDSYSENRSASRDSNMSADDDWDRIDSAVDLDAAIRLLGDGTATIKGKNGCPPYVFSQSHARRPVTPIAAQTRPSCRSESRRLRLLRPMRSTRLSNVEEVDDDDVPSRPHSRTNRRPKTSPHHPPSRSQQQLAAAAFGGRSGSVRSAPPRQAFDVDGQAPDTKLSMTPESIRPLLENAKEVHVRLNDCMRFWTRTHPRSLNYSLFHIPTHVTDIIVSIILLHASSRALCFFLFCSTYRRSGIYVHLSGVQCYPCCFTFSFFLSRRCEFSICHSIPLHPSALRRY